MYDRRIAGIASLFSSYECSFCDDSLFEMFRRTLFELEKDGLRTKNAEDGRLAGVATGGFGGKKL